MPSKEEAIKDIISGLEQLDNEHVKQCACTICEHCIEKTWSTAYGQGYQKGYESGYNTARAKYTHVSGFKTAGC